MVQDEYLAEIVACYADTVMEVAHVCERGRYVIGEGPRTDFTTTGEALSDPEGSALVRAEQGGFWLDFTAAMRGRVRMDGCTRSFAQLIRAGEATPEGGHFCVLLQPGAEAWIERGRLQFRVRVVARELVHARRVTVDRGFLGYLGAMAAFGLALLGLLRSIPPDALALEQANLREPDPAYRLAMQLDARPKPTLVAAIDDHGERDASDSGAGVDEPFARAADGVSTLPRRASRKPKPWQRPIASTRVDHCGHWSSSTTLLELAGPHVERFAAASPAAFTAEVEDHELWRAMTRPLELDPELRLGGLGLIGRGRGGDGLDGLGGRGERHRNRLCGAWCPTGRDQPRERMLTLHIGEARVDGELQAHALRRVVRAHQDELVACLAKASAKQQDSTGELTVNFAIAPNGRVATAVIDHTTLDDRHIARCITRAMEGWRFPSSPTGATVLVVHEFEFGWKTDYHRRR